MSTSAAIWEFDGAEPAEITVGDVMTTRAAAVPPWISVEAARKVAALKSVDHLLVEQSGRLVGIVSGIDLEAAEAEDRVGSLAQGLTVCVRPLTPLERARDLMLKHRLVCLPVFAGTWLLGLVTHDAVERGLRARPVDMLRSA
jgi:CBS domain-containing protein